MIRTLHSAASGMAAQQLQLESIAQNLANVNTPGYRRGQGEFRELLYAQVGQLGPTGLAQVPVGHGVRLAATWTDQTEGALEETGQPLDLAIRGAGFFRVLRPDGTEAYTRAGPFTRDGEGRLTTAAGDLVLGPEGLIRLEPGENAVAERLSLALFANPGGLLPLGENLWLASNQSGPARLVRPGEEGAGRVLTGHLEASNVRAADELVSLMAAQRAYQLSARLIQSADEMMGTTNNLRRA